MANNNDIIDNYLADQMTPEENEAFLNDLRNDKDLREEAQMMALMIKEMKEEQARQDSEIIEEIQSDKGIGVAACRGPKINRDIKNPSKKAKIVTKIVSMVRWPLSIAAMFVLIFGAILLWNRQSDTDTLFTEYYSSYTLQGESRGGNSDVEIEKELAVLFNQVGTEEDISTVIDKLQKIYDSVDSDYEYSLYADDIAWYLALAYLKEDKPEKAKELLKPLVSNGHEKAIALIKEIE